jgi:DNA invertase Pin-like site-specific DNA recombinase
VVGPLQNVIHFHDLRGGLGRNTEQAHINVLSEWCDKGLRVVSVTQQIDFNGTVAKILAAVLLGIAQMEQETRREPQAAGIAVAKKRGKYRGAAIRRPVGLTPMRSSAKKTAAVLTPPKSIPTNRGQTCN